ncbi:LamG-like jellyroll fold domain-containing protein [Trichlorobacter lovleyi]|uniref:LamG-like jellyroll fold domain-containing protein n=1 Tax=Trichlorobacter lovleyi TaxID=313985 RepID=UPI0024802D28|nr:LamG-like jellyroll fold domain-containing protein [Trichlorobacter lovleyi]
MLRQLKLMLVLLFSTLLFCSPAWSLDRFIDLNDGTMLDTSSSLRWLKKANCIHTRWDIAVWGAATLAAPSCGLTDRSVAGDWHLPSTDELQTLVADNYRADSLNTAGFDSVQNELYWSSSSFEGTNTAWGVHMYDGSVRATSKEFPLYGLPVRSGQYWSLNPLVIFGIVDFGSMHVGSVSSNHQFTLKNSALTSQLISSIVLSGADPGQFVLSTGDVTPCSSLTSLTLAAGASCNVVVTAKPTSAGSKSANLTFIANGASTDATLSVTGVAAVTYNSNGSTSGVVPTDSQGYLSGATVTVLANSGTLAKTGYIFNGWNTATDGSGTSYQPGATFSYAAPVTLYAKWSVPTAPPAGLVSWWRGEGNPNDTQGRNNGTLQGGVTYVPGLVGQAFNFEGSTAQYVSVPSSSSLNIYGTHSVSFWVKLTTLPPAGKAYYVVSKWANAAEHKQININADGKVFYYLHGTTAGSGVTTTAALQTGVWTHVAATYDGANMKIYINGALNAGVSASNDVWDSSGTLYLGYNPLIAASYSGANFNGQLDELGWFNSALSATEIANIYNAGSAGWALPRFIDLNDGTMLDTSSSLRWLKNAGCLGTQKWDAAISSAASLAAPACGLTDGTMAGDWHLPTIEELQTLVAAPDSLRYDTLNAAGFADVQAYWYWSSSSYINNSNLAWDVKLTDGNSYCDPKFNASRVWPVRSGQYWLLDSLVISGNSDFWSVPVGSTSSGHPFTLKNNGANPLSVTSISLSGTDSGQFTLATGGTNPCSSLTSLTLAGGAGCTVLISAKPTTISSKSANLTVTSAGLSLNVPLSATGAALSVTYNGNGNSSGSVPLDSTGYALNATATVLDNSGVLAKSGYAFNGWNTAVDGSGTTYQPGATFSIAAPTTLYAKWTAPIAPPTGLVSWWRGENNGLDALGANNGTLHSASSFAFATGKVGQAFSFSGAATEYVDAPSSASLNFGTNDFAIAAWIKTTLPSAQYTWKRLVTKRATSGNWYSLALNGPVAGAVTFEIAASVSMSSNVAVNDGKWHHIAVSRDPVGTSPRKYRMYLDGVENSSMIDSGWNLDNSGPLEMGKWAAESNGGIYSGLMDEVQIFSRSLSATEIQSIYNAGAAGLALTPTVTGISPSSGYASGGTTVTITGSNLSGATAVNFDTTAATGFTVNSDTQATATSPAGVVGQTVDITVTTPGGTSAVSSADQFSYTLQYQAKNQSTTTSYTTLAEAIANASAGHEIRAYGGQFDGALSLVRDIILNGGYNMAFSAKDSLPTTLNGSLTVTGGTARVDSVTVKGVLTIGNGSLQASGLVVQ